jgi:hypothetical protein
MLDLLGKTDGRAVRATRISCKHTYKVLAGCILRPAMAISRVVTAATLGSN